MNTLPAFTNNVIEVIPANVTAGNPNYNRQQLPHVPQPEHYYPLAQQSTTQPLDQNRVVNRLAPNETVTVTTTFTRASNQQASQAPLEQADSLGTQQSICLGIGAFIAVIFIIGSLR